MHGFHTHNDGLGVLLTFKILLHDFKAFILSVRLINIYMFSKKELEESHNFPVKWSKWTTRRIDFLYSYLEIDSTYLLFLKEKQSQFYIIIFWKITLKKKQKKRVYSILTIVSVADSEAMKTKSQGYI